MAAYLEHMAFKVKDFDWHVKFFQDVFDMPVRQSLGKAPNRKIWLHAGIQLNEDLDFDGREGRADHLGIMVEDVDATIEKAYVFGAKSLSQGKNWLELPSGMVLELIRCKTDVLKEILEKEPWVQD